MRYWNYKAVNDVAYDHEAVDRGLHSIEEDLKHRTEKGHAPANDSQKGQLTYFFAVVH